LVVIMGGRIDIQIYTDTHPTRPTGNLSMIFNKYTVYTV